MKRVWLEVPSRSIFLFFFVNLYLFSYVVISFNTFIGILNSLKLAVKICIFMNCLMAISDGKILT